ncbi:prolipoprotein diacylglyceryl transferase family protein [Acidipila sp. EB88]|uniref:prolipoprotein diacylglyceryl transferase family protein n=1 Tax=Acidipila sp. EB88 TaxID=2305226 RepID=UPI0013155D07|nr:prolipoprotein diacylglyceryl transferase family protein [Acidipila sp. EB88]
MFPFLPFPFFSISIQSLLIGLGVLAALRTAERLAWRLGLAAHPVSTAALLAGAGLILGPRLILLIAGWRDFVAHPSWMLSLFHVEDPRLLYAGAVIGLIVATGSLMRARVNVLLAANALLPCVTLLLAFVHAGYFAEGAEPGRIVAARWGVICTRHLARTLYGTPLDVPLVPVAAYGSAGFALLALGTVWMAARDEPPPARCCYSRACCRSSLGKGSYAGQANRCCSVHLPGRRRQGR